MFLKSYCIIFLFVTQVNSQTFQVKLKQGKIIGKRSETVFDGRSYYVFYGVPYAKPPVGKLRFKDPKPPRKWKHPFDATVEYHGACAQSHIVHKHGLYGYEDCLHLNIYTPMLPRDSSTQPLKAVLVYVHGYAFTSSISHIYGADFLIEQDIVFITVTHRIGVFGFLKVDESEPDVNMGLKDIVMALKWIRKNIKHFGGDKNKITLMGSDSGATFLSLLLMTKHRNMFSKMILQSGSIFSPSIFQSDYQMERETFKRNIRKMGIQDLRNASSKDIISASQKIYSSKEIINFQKPIVPFTPIIEKQSNNSLLTIRPEEFFKSVKRRINKPILVGFNSRESISEVIPFLHNSHYLNYFSSFFKFMIPFSDGCVFNFTSDTYNRVASIIKSHYFNNSINEKSIDDFLQYTTDLKKYPVLKFIQEHLKISKTETFVYKFNYVGAFNAVRATSMTGAKVNVKGASNGDELCYILKCEPFWENYVKIHNETENRDRIFIKYITELWANFVKTGKPTPNPQPGHTVWKPITQEQSYILLFGNVTKLVDTKTEKDTFAFWNNIYTSFYSKIHCSKEPHEEL
ncbi:esterase E4-like [Ostrinia furnacalis]|uniref:esterase E4-like n=1 Tax=Ostrinia furnacalis TaxID=93504 RepID=UPI00103A7D58|nr:esterase E4-like [Ostrinia furnacalis]